MSAAVQNELERLRAMVERLEESLRHCRRSRDEWRHMAESAASEVETYRKERDCYKAQWQADGISQYARSYLVGLEQELAEIYAAKLRRQAEEDS